MGWTKAIKNTAGEARLIVLLGAVALVLAALIVVPLARNASEERLLTLDEEYVTAAERVARQDYLGNGKAFTAVYDSENKRFVAADALSEVTAYANAAAHQGMYLVVTVDTEEMIRSAWMTEDEIKALAKEE